MTTIGVAVFLRDGTISLQAQRMLHKIGMYSADRHAVDATPAAQLEHGLPWNNERTRHYILWSWTSRSVAAVSNCQDVVSRFVLRLKGFAIIHQLDSEKGVTRQWSEADYCSIILSCFCTRPN